MIAIIPARGGSKGLPGKNLKKISGISLVGIAVKTALNSKCIKRTIVSTDSRDIALEAKKWGAEIPFMRPEYLADDTSSAIDVYIYTLNKLSEIEGTPLAKEFVVLQPTSPLRQAEDIDNAIRIFKQKKSRFCNQRNTCPSSYMVGT